MTTILPSKSLPSSTSTSHTYMSNLHHRPSTPRDEEEEDFIDHDGCYSEHGRLLCGPNIAPNPHGNLPVYMTIHRLVLHCFVAFDAGGLGEYVSVSRYRKRSQLQYNLGLEVLIECKYRIRRLVTTSIGIFSLRIKFRA